MNPDMIPIESNLELPAYVKKRPNEALGKRK